VNATLDGLVIYVMQKSTTVNLIHVRMASARTRMKDMNAAVKKDGLGSIVIN